MGLDTNTCLGVVSALVMLPMINETLANNYLDSLSCPTERLFVLWVFAHGYNVDFARKARLRWSSERYSYLYSRRPWDFYPWYWGVGDVSYVPFVRAASELLGNDKVYKYEEYRLAYCLCVLGLSFQGCSILLFAAPTWEQFWNAEIKWRIAHNYWEM